MNNLKRVLSLALSGIMLVGMMAVSASAADFKDADEIVNTDAVDTMVALNIINGKDDGSFAPQEIVTRSQMAKMITVALNGGKDPVLGTSATPKFSDIKGHWAEKYIEYCANLGIINGRGDGTFDPDATVTGTEAAKMMLVAMGYDSTVFKFTGADWAMNVNIEANNAKPNKLYAGIETVDPTQGLSRDNAAQLIFNGIQDDTMERSPSMTITNGEISYDYKSDGPSILGGKYGAEIEYGYLTGASLDDEKGEYTYSLTASSDFGGEAITTDGVSVASLTTDRDYTDLYGHKVKVIYKTNKTKDVLGIYRSESTVLASGVIDDLPTGSSALTGADKSFKFDGVTYRFDGNTAGTASGVKFYEVLNGQMTGKDLTNFAGVAAEYAIELIDNDDDGQVNCVMVYPFTVAKVSYVGKDSFNTSANPVMGVVAATGIKFDDVNFYDGLAKDDYVKIIPAANCANSKVTYEKIEDDAVVEGKVTSTKAGAVEIDGDWYSFSASGTPYTLGSTYKLVMVNGYVCADASVTSGAAIGDYAFVVDAKGSGSNGMNGDQAKLLFTDGTTKVVDTDADYSGTALNKLVTYEIDGGEYKLTLASTLTAGTNGTSGFDKKESSVAYAYTAGGKSDIDGDIINDDAVIFTWNGSKAKVITGADLKKYPAGTNGVDNTFADKIAFANKTSATGYYGVTLALVKVDTTITAQTENYGYVTSGLTTTKNSDGSTVNVLTFWTADGEVKNAMTDSRVDATVAKGSVITYEANSNGSYTVRLANVNRAAIIAYNEKTGAIRFSGAGLTSSGAADREVTKDTVILGINSDSKSGVEGPEIALAVETATSGLYQANAYWFSSVAASGAELDVLVIDTYANLPLMPGKVSFGAAATQAQIQAALDNSATVEIGADLTTSGISLNVADGQTLKITAVQTNDITIAVAEGAKIEIPNGKLLGGSDAAFTADGDVTIHTASGGVQATAAAGTTLTVNSNVSLGANDVITVSATGAALEGAADGVELTLAATSNVVGGTFYADTDDADADSVEAATYKWTTFEVAGENEGDPATSVTGWVKQ